MAAFAVITACFNNIAIGMTFQRDTGVLKRTNGTPIPSAGHFLAARVLHALLVVVGPARRDHRGFGRVAYRAHVPAGSRWSISS